VAEVSAIIRVAGVTKTFNGIHAVADLTFEVHSGEIFGFIGPSGCGKTTTIRMLCGVYRPSQGSVEVLGVSPERFDRRVREKIGYMPQLFVLYPTLSVEENLNFAASLYGMGWWSRRRRRRELLDFVELWDHRKKLARDISGGMQRRLELATCLMHRPPLVFMDEPTAGIDPVLRARFWQGFRQLKAEGHTLFVTTQYVTESEYCDRVAVMNRGRLIALDSPDSLRRTAFGGEILDITGRGLSHTALRVLADVPGFRRTETVTPTTARVVFDDAAPAIPHVLGALSQVEVQVEAVEEYKPSFDEVFVQLIGKDQQDD
jgi:ABC-2 type transport system ATP-binding protein